MTTENHVKLGTLRKGARARISGVSSANLDSDTLHPELLIERLLSMGFLEGSVIEVLHEGPFGGDPMAVRVRGTLVALRRKEANAVEVSVL